MKAPSRKCYTAKHFLKGAIFRCFNATLLKDGYAWLETVAGEITQTENAIRHYTPKVLYKN